MAEMHNQQARSVYHLMLVECSRAFGVRLLVRSGQQCQPAVSVHHPAATACVCGAVVVHFALQGPGAPGAGATPEITCVAWNKKVQHILASTQVCWAGGGWVGRGAVSLGVAAQQLSKRYML
jgi:hypothetical protein